MWVPVHLGVDILKCHWTETLLRHSSIDAPLSTPYRWGRLGFVLFCDPNFLSHGPPPPPPPGKKKKNSVNFGVILTGKIALSASVLHFHVSFAPVSVYCKG